MTKTPTENGATAAANTSVRSRTPESGRETRERVVQAAAHLFARRGYSGVSIADVATAAGVSKAGLLHHFASKEVLFLAVVERFSAATWLPALMPEDGSVSLWDHLESWDCSLVEDRSRPDLVALIVSTSIGALDVDHPARDVVRDGVTETHRRLAEAIEIGKRLGQVVPEAPTEEIVQGLTSISGGGQAQWLIGDSLGLESGPASGELASLFIGLVRARWGQD